MVIIIHATVFIHSSGEATFLNYYIYRRISDFGVVFFFGVTGFFIGRNKDTNRIESSIRKLMDMYLFATFSLFVSNLIFVVIEKLLFSNSMMTGLMNILNRFSLINFITGEALYSSLWYLPAAIISSMIFYFYCKYKISNKSIIIVTLAIYLLLNYSSFEINRLLPNGGFAKGLISMAVGYLAQQYGKNYTYSLPLSITLVILGAALSVKQYSIFIVFLLTSVYLILSYCKFNPGKKNRISSLGSNGMSVYVFHVIAIRIVSIFFEYLNINKMNYKMVYVLLTIILSFLLSPILLKIFNKIYKMLIEIILSEKNSSLKFISKPNK